MIANSMDVLVSRSLVNVSVVWRNVVVFIRFLAFRFSDVLGVPPPMWFGWVYVVVLFLAWRGGARLR